MSDESSAPPATARAEKNVKPDLVEPSGTVPITEPGDTEPTPPAVRVDRPGSPTREEVRRQIESTRASISLRLDSIQNEITSAGDDARRYVKDRPLVGVGIALGLGLLTGVVAGGVGAARQRDEEHLASVLREELAAGQSVSDAARAATRRAQWTADHNGSAAPKKKSTFIKPLMTSLVTIALREGVRRLFSTDDEDADLDPSS